MAHLKLLPLVAAVVILLFAFPSFQMAVEKEKAGNHNDGDSGVELLREELQLVKDMLKKLTEALAADDKTKSLDILKQLLAQLEASEKQLNSIREANKKAARKKELKKKRETSGIRQDIDSIKRTLEELTGGVQFSGFFDVTASGYKVNPNIFALGGFELDMEKSFGDNFQVAAALVFSDDGAELAVGFIDFHLFGGSVAARGRVFTEKGLHFQVGRFDIPFGNDWKFYAPVDRMSVTAPLTTELVMDGGYNDVGLRILRGNVTYNWTLYMLRGIEEGFSVGGRFGFTPFNNPFTFKRKEARQLELGFSYLHDMNRSGKREEWALGVDLESNLGPVLLQAEYLQRDNRVAGCRFQGYHVSAFLQIGSIGSVPLTFFGRYDSLEQEALEDNGAADGLLPELSRLTIGVHLNLFDISTLKIEFLQYLEEHEEFEGASFTAQLVITF